LVDSEVSLVLFVAKSKAAKRGRGRRMILNIQILAGYVLAYSSARR
jgi:hypothetical protein